MLQQIQRVGLNIRCHLSRQGTKRTHGIKDHHHRRLVPRPQHVHQLIVAHPVSDPVTTRLHIRDVPLLLSHPPERFLIDQNTLTRQVLIHLLKTASGKNIKESMPFSNLHILIKYTLVLAENHDHTDHQSDKYHQQRYPYILAAPPGPSSF